MSDLMYKVHCLKHFQRYNPTSFKFTLFLETLFKWNLSQAYDCSFASVDRRHISINHLLLSLDLSHACQFQTICALMEFFLFKYVEERPWQPRQSPNKEQRRKRKAKRIERSDQVY